MEEVGKHFKPIWLDEIVMFDRLSHKQLRKVVRLQMKGVVVLLVERGLLWPPLMPPWYCSL